MELSSTGVKTLICRICVSLPFWWLARTAIWIMKVLIGSFVRLKDSKWEKIKYFKNVACRILVIFVPSFIYFNIYGSVVHLLSHLVQERNVNPSTGFNHLQLLQRQEESWGLTERSRGEFRLQYCWETCYPDFLQVVEIVPYSYWDFTGCVALIWFVISINAQHLHCCSPPTNENEIQRWQLCNIN